LTDQSFIWTHRDGRQAAKRQLLDKLGSVKLKYLKLETSNVSELAASGLDRLMIKIKTARRKLTLFISFADGDCRFLSGRGNRHCAELLAERNPLSVLQFVRAKALSSESKLLRSFVNYRESNPTDIERIAIFQVHNRRAFCGCGAVTSR